MERLREKGNVVQLIGQQFWPEKTVLFQKKKILQDYLFDYPTL